MKAVQTAQLPSEKKFGLLFTFVFMTVAVLGHYKDWSKQSVALWFALAIFVALLTLIAPKSLAPFNRAWFMLGQLMGRVVSPIVLGAIFFLILTPVAIVTRLFGRDELRLKKVSVISYWIDRKDEVSPEDSFKNQF